MSNAADVRPRPVKILLDKERALLFDLNSFVCLEEEYGSADEALDAFTKGSVKAIRALLWAGLQHEDEALTPRDVGKMVSLADLPKVAEPLKEALEQSLPKPEKKPENPPE